jgi:hypothetical protein
MKLGIKTIKYIPNEGLLVGRCISVVFSYIDSFLISLIRLYKCLGAHSPSLYDMWADAAYGRITIYYQIRASSILYRVCRSGLDISCFLSYIRFCVVGLPLCFRKTTLSRAPLKLKFLGLAVDGESLSIIYYILSDPSF